MPSLSAADIARSTFLLVLRWDVNLGSPPESLALGSRMRWRPAGAGHFVYLFADGLLVLTKEACRSLPRIPPLPELARIRVGKAVVLGAHTVTGPLSPLIDLAGMVAEGIADQALDDVNRRYDKAHPERGREHKEKAARWQQQFAAEILGADGVFALPRSNLVRVSIVPFMLYGLNLQLCDDRGEASAYTFKASAPARRAMETAQKHFLGRMQREMAWFSGQHVDKGLTESELRVRLKLDMRELLPYYGKLPPCARLLDKSLPGWRETPYS
jgi:hypothetical protein